jgi:hypothetical protein
MVENQILTGFLIVYSFNSDVTETLTWMGLGDIINKFRTGLGLQKLPINVAPRLISNQLVPHTYCWSPGLIPKPADWGSHIDISGFFFLDLASNYEPPQDLVDFLKEPTIYIGFGSIVVDDPDGLSRLLFEALAMSNVRAIISKGWGGLGTDNIPSNVYMIGNCPHDWLFEHVKAVVHHGGAGTTATGLLKGKPTVIVPFFGDQPFWGAMVSKRKCGPDPIPFKKLTAENLSKAILFALQDDIYLNAQRLGAEIRKENGVEMGLESFHRHLPIKSMACDIVPTQLAVYYIKKANIQVSQFAAEILISQGKITSSDLLTYKTKIWDIVGPPADLIDSTVQSLDAITLNTFKGIKNKFSFWLVYCYGK